MPDPDQRSLIISLIEGTREDSKAQREEIRGLRTDLVSMRDVLSKDSVAFHEFVQKSTSTMTSLQGQIEALTVRQNANTTAIEELKLTDKKRLAVVAGINIALGGLFTVVTTIIGWLWLMPDWAKGAIARAIGGNGGGSGMP